MELTKILREERLKHQKSIEDTIICSVYLTTVKYVTGKKEPQCFTSIETIKEIRELVYSDFNQEETDDLTKHDRFTRLYNTRDLDSAMDSLVDIHSLQSDSELWIFKALDEAKEHFLNKPKDMTNEQYKHVLDSFNDVSYSELARIK